ncbi:MAG: hypothetical protein WBZ57_17810 [Pseudomonas graminis]
MDENTATGTVGSLIPSDWGNAVTDEILNTIRGASLEPKENTNTQLLAAIKAIIGSQIATLKNMVRLTANGIFVVPTGVFQIWVSGCAAGGGGGGSLATNSSSFVTGGSGGGAGQPVIRQVISVMPGQIIPYVIGAPGVGATSAANNATDGGATLFGESGSLLKLLGGKKGLLGSGGTASPANYAGPEGGEGYPKGGYASDTMVYSGGQASGGMGGIGGSTPFGNAGPPGRGAVGANPNAFPGSGYGAGGSGSGGAYTSPVSAPGGTGAPGLQGVLILEW